MKKALLAFGVSCLVSLSAAAATKTWTGAVNNLWSVSGNWTGGTPADGDQLVFPDGASNRTMSNDLSGLDLLSISFPGTSSNYSASGNAITLSGGITTASTCCRLITWSIPITLTGSQTFGGSDVTFASTIDLNGNALTIMPQFTVLSGSLIGSGTFTLGNGTGGGMRLTGTSTFSGTFTQFAILDITGSISNSTMNGSSILTGTGTVPALTFAGVIRPGVDGSPDDPSDVHSTGILSTGSLTLNHVNDPSLAIDIHGLIPGTEHDQLAVAGSVTLNGSPTLEVKMEGIPSPGQQFIIISNDGADPVSGTFSGLPEGATVPGVQGSPTITYAGGDGNDVALIIPGVPPKSWTGAVNNLWSAGGNWTDGVPPVDGDELTFPDFASNRNMVNDLSGLDLASLHFTGNRTSYSASGNAITLSSGITTKLYRPVTWSIPITLAASQTFEGAQVTFAGPIDLNGHALTIVSYLTEISGSLTGSGALTHQGFVFGGLRLTGTFTFSGTFANYAFLDVTGSISNSTMNGSSILSGTGTIPALTFEGVIRPGQDTNVTDGGDDAHTTGILSTGPLTLNHVNNPSVAIDILGTIPGTNYDQIAVTGTVTLNSNPTLEVRVPGPLPSPGQTYIILANDGADAINGTFNGLPEGAVVNSVGGGPAFRISYIGGTGNDVVLTALAATTTVLTVSPAAVVTGQPFGVSATVSSSSGTPTGTVEFREGATVLGTGTLDGAGVANATISLPAGTHSITAVYLGAGTFAPSTSAPASKNVAKGNSSTTLTVISPATIGHGDTLTVQVAVAAVAPATGMPTGTATVSADGQTDSGLLSGSGAFTAGLTSLTPGIHTVTASYGGDTNFLSSSASTDIEVFARISSTDPQASEGTIANVVVTLSGASNQTVKVDYTTMNGTANAGSDYVATSGTLEFAPGVTSQTIQVMINSDGIQEPNETIRVVFSNPQHAVLDDSEATITAADALAAGVPTLSTIGLLLFGLAIAAAGMFAMRS